MKTGLVIDRDQECPSLVTALQDSGFRVVEEEEESGNGLRTAVEVVPYLIIVDESMPPLDGIDLLLLLRSWP